MDRVRFGRALGVGARAAAKTLMSAADAAAAPNPAVSAPAARQASAPAPLRPAASRVHVPDRKAVKTHARSLKRSLWSPVARFSNVLWLEVTGVFFALFALMMGKEVWKWHAAMKLSPSAPDAQRLYVYAVLFVLFGYFAVSSFVRASRRQRR